MKEGGVCGVSKGTIKEFVLSKQCKFPKTLKQSNNRPSQFGMLSSAWKQNHTSLIILVRG
jgi:hypothetical protein